MLSSQHGHESVNCLIDKQIFIFTLSSVGQSECWWFYFVYMDALCQYFNVTFVLMLLAQISKPSFIEFMYLMIISVNLVNVQMKIGIGLHKFKLVNHSYYHQI